MMDARWQIKGRTRERGRRRGSNKIHALNTAWQIYFIAWLDQLQWRHLSVSPGPHSCMPAWLAGWSGSPSDGPELPPPFPPLPPSTHSSPSSSTPLVLFIPFLLNIPLFLFVLNPLSSSSSSFNHFATSAPRKSQ